MSASGQQLYLAAQAEGWPGEPTASLRPSSYRLCYDNGLLIFQVLRKLERLLSDCIHYTIRVANRFVKCIIDNTNAAHLNSFHYFVNVDIELNNNLRNTSCFDLSLT